MFLYYPYFWLSCVCFLILEWSLYFIFCFFCHIVYHIIIFYWLFILDCILDRFRNGLKIRAAMEINILMLNWKEYQLVRIMKRRNYSITKKHFSDMLLPNVTKTLPKPMAVCYFIIHIGACQLLRPEPCLLNRQIARILMSRNWKIKLQGGLTSLLSGLDRRRKSKLKRNRKEKMVLLYLSIWEMVMQ